MTSLTEQDRAAFEEWRSSQLTDDMRETLLRKVRDGIYSQTIVVAQWIAWQAALAYARERQEKGL